MRIAQQLYEGVDIKGRGTIGLITYLRTDSTRVSETAEVQVKEFIESKYGDSYMAKEINSKKSNKKIQDAHEAIRPTDVNLMPEEVKTSFQEIYLDYISLSGEDLLQAVWKIQFTKQLT